MLVQPAADTFTLVSKDPSPSNLVAVITPAIKVSPSTLSLYPFAVVPIPVSYTHLTLPTKLEV